MIKQMSNTKNYENEINRLQEIIMIKNSEQEEAKQKLTHCESKMEELHKLSLQKETKINELKRDLDESKKWQVEHVKRSETLTRKK